MIKTKVKMVEQEEKYIVCDRCERDMSPRYDSSNNSRIEQKIILRGVGIDYLNWVHT